MFGWSIEEEAFDSGLMLSMVMVDAAIVPGIERRFCETSKSTKTGSLPSLMAAIIVKQQVGEQISEKQVRKQVNKSDLWKILNCCQIN